MSDDSTIVEESSQVMGTYGISKLDKVSNECWAFFGAVNFHFTLLQTVFLTIIAHTGQGNEFIKIYYFQVLLLVFLD